MGIPRDALAPYLWSAVSAGVQLRAKEKEISVVAWELGKGKDFLLDNQKCQNLTLKLTLYRQSIFWYFVKDTKSKVRS